MARYTSMQVFEFNRSQEYRAVIPDAGTSVSVEIWSGAEWVPDPLSPITAPDLVYCHGLNIRMTPTGGGFYVEEGTQ